MSSMPPPPSDGGYPPPPPSEGGYPSLPPPPSGYDYGPPMPVGNNQKAVWSLIVGIVGLFCSGIVLGPIAIALGIIARKEIGRSGGMQSGTGMATAGVVLGVISVIFTLIVFAFVLPGLVTSS